MKQVGSRERRIDHEFRLVEAEGVPEVRRARCCKIGIDWKARQTRQTICSQ